MNEQELRQKVADYLAAQFLAGDLPDDECYEEADHIIEMVKEAMKDVNDG